MMLGRSCRRVGWRNFHPQRWIQSATFSSSSSPCSASAADSTDERVLLTRDFIHSCLYSHQHGYFSTDGREVLYAPPEAIDFPNLWGSYDYQKIIAGYYKASKEAWLTPVEIFSPHYSHALATYMINSPVWKNKLDIYEIGGGSGTNALNILNFLKTMYPKIYKDATYTIVEISPVMAARQRERVASLHPNCRIINTDILTYSQSYPSVSTDCFVMAMEVLDNLPHDKVLLQHGKWRESIVRMRPKGNGNTEDFDLEEDHRPLQDPLICQALEVYGCDLPVRIDYKFNSRSVQAIRDLLGWDGKELYSAFIPTGAMRLLNVLKKSFPQHHLIAADFDSLPSPTLKKSSAIKPLNHPKSPTSTTSGTLHAAGAPLVASKTSGETEDHDTYLVKGGIADIFFPTDFSRLKRAYCSYMDRSEMQVSVVKSEVFLQEFADVNQTKTETGYNPLVEDYANTSFILS